MTLEHVRLRAERMRVTLEHVRLRAGHMRVDLEHVRVDLERVRVKLAHMRAMSEPCGRHGNSCDWRRWVRGFKETHELIENAPISLE